MKGKDERKGGGERWEGKGRADKPDSWLAER